MKLKWFDDKILNQFTFLLGALPESISMTKTHESSYVNDNGKEITDAKIKQQR